MSSWPPGSSHGIGTRQPRFGNRLPVQGPLHAPSNTSLWGSVSQRFRRPGPATLRRIACARCFWSASAHDGLYLFAVKFSQGRSPHGSCRSDKRNRDTMHRRFFSLRQFSVILISVGVGLIGGILLDHPGLIAFAPSATGATETAPNWRLLAEVWHTIQRFYVDRSAVQPHRLTYGAINGMVDALGDTGHSSFLTPEMVDLMRSVTEGQFEGIGAEVQMKDKHVVIVAPLDNSPAQRAGLRPGDIILQVNQESITRLPLEQVVLRIRGPRGTAVTLTLFDPNTEQSRDVTVVRARVAVHNVTWQQLPGTMVVHVRIAEFSQESATTCSRR